MGETIDIIMVSYKHPEDLRQALETLYANTPVGSFTLHLIDNDGVETCKFYNACAREYDNIHYHYYNNVGWIEAINDIYNKFVKRSEGKFFLTCHTDVIFEKDWLPKMLKGMQDDKIAMVGPTSNFILGLQSIQFNLPGVTYETSKFICGLFCLFRKTAINKLIEQDGYFMDPIFGMGDKEELDYAIRLGRLGYQFVIARNVFIAHQGEKGFADFAGNKEKFHEYQNTRLQLLIAKWGKEIVNDLYKINLADRLHVFVCTPMRSNYVHYRFMAAMMSLQKAPRFEFISSVHYVIDEARNVLAEKSLEKGATHILFVDDDMMPPPDAAIRLLKHDVDIVCALTFSRLPPHCPCIFKNVGQDIYPIESINKGLIEIDACSGAFVLIKSDVFKQMPKKWYKPGDNTLAIYKKAGGLSEDIGFSFKAKRIGLGVYCDTDLIVPHVDDEEMIYDKVSI